MPVIKPDLNRFSKLMKTLRDIQDLLQKMLDISTDNKRS